MPVIQVAAFRILEHGPEDAATVPLGDQLCLSEHHYVGLPLLQG